jgi:hypothetical protein
MLIQWDMVSLPGRVREWTTLVNIKSLAVYLVTRIKIYLFLGSINIVDSQSVSEIDNNLTDEGGELQRSRLISAVNKNKHAFKSYVLERIEFSY